MLFYHIFLQKVAKHNNPDYIISIMKTYTIAPHCHSEWPLSVWKGFRIHPVETEHFHDCFEIMIALTDGGVCFLDGVGYHIHTGSVFVCSPTTSHAFTLPVGSEFCNIMFLPEVLSKEGQKMLASLRPGAYDLFDPGQVRHFERQFTTMERELLEQKEGFQAYTGAWLQLLLTGICRRIKNLPDINGTEPDDKMVKLVLYIHRHFREKISLASLSEYSGLPEGTISRLFKREAGRSFRQYLQIYRIGKAEEMLKSTNLSLTEIAYQTGFFDSAHFTKTFIKVAGTTPLSYRRNSR